MISDVCDTQFALLGNMTNPLAATVEVYNSDSMTGVNGQQCVLFLNGNTSDLDI